MNLADYGILEVDEDELRLALFPEDLQNSIDLPTACWPAYRTLYGGDPPIALYEQSQIAGLEGVRPTTTQNRGAGRDFVSRALERAGAHRVDSAEWLMMNEKGDTYNPPMVSGFAAYRLPIRLIREHCNSNGPRGCRSGPRARGSLSQCVVAPEFVPPAARKVSPREITRILESPLQEGYPASMITGASSGYSAMGYQSWDVVFDHCEASTSTLVRLEGRLSKGHGGEARDGLCQKAKVGYCPCCTRAAHVAIPPAYRLRALGPLKRMGIRLWPAFGPWAPRRLAAIDYSMRYINSYPLPVGWDWAAKALDFPAPAPILRGVPGWEPIVIQTIAQTRPPNVARPTPPPPEAPKKAVVPTIAQTKFPATVPPTPKPLGGQKHAGAALAPLVGTQTLQPKPHET